MFGHVECRSRSPLAPRHARKSVEIVRAQWGMQLLARTSGPFHCLVGFAVHVAHSFLEGHNQSA
jgi:hypothetical protein